MSYPHLPEAVPQLATSGEVDEESMSAYKKWLYDEWETVEAWVDDDPEAFEKWVEGALVLGFVLGGGTVELVRTAEEGARG